MTRPALPPSERIAADIRAKIKSGELGPGDQIETVDQLAERFKVSRGTVAKALDKLRRERLIVSTHGWGSHVTEPEAREQGKRL
jgi:DNA-binding GntR family transcriptional regulator